MHLLTRLVRPPPPRSIAAQVAQVDLSAVRRSALAAGAVGEDELVDQRLERRVVEQPRQRVAERLALDEPLHAPRLGDLDQGLVAAEREQGLAEAARRR